MNNRRTGIYTAYAVLLLVVLPFLVLYVGAGMRFFVVPSESMVPTLQIADYLLTFPKREYAPGEVVVLRDPEAPGEFIVKRIVATEGQVVRTRDGALFVNGRYVSEPYLREPIKYEMSEFTVPDDAVFVLGDNRNNSEDSHNWSRDRRNPRDPGKPMALLESEIVGRVSAIYLPFNRMQRVRPYPIDQLRT